MDEKVRVKRPHRLNMEDRKRIDFTGITDVVSFDPVKVVLESDYGHITIKGEGLHVNRLSVEKGELDLDGVEVNAGNGNGFKMGGDSMSGYHELRNSIAFYNKAKGIDSNSCPDSQVYDCVSFENESYNVAFYTSGSASTDFAADGVLSYRTENLSMGEQIKAQGTQDMNKIYGVSNYYWDAGKALSVKKLVDE